MQGAQGFRILGDAAFAAGGGLTTAALRVDQVADAVATVADHFGWSADGSGDHLETDHHDAQVEAFVKAFQQHAVVERLGALDGGLHLGRRAQVDRHPLALLAIHRLDYQAAVFGEERGVVFGAAGQALGWQVQARAGPGAMGQALVLAEGHAHRAGQVGQRFAAADAPPAVAQGEEPHFGIVHVHLDAAAQRLVNDDSRVGVHLRLWARAEEQWLVDAVLALDAEGLQLAETQLGVELLGLVVVVQHREVEVAEAAAHEMLDQVAYQHFANAGAAAVWVDRQAPEAAAVFRVAIGLEVIEAHHAADHRAAVFVFGQPVHRAALVSRGELGRVDRQHAAHLVQAVDRLPVLGVLCTADAVTAKAAMGLAVVAEPQAQGVGGVEEQLLRCLRQHLLWRRHIQGDIALARQFGEQVIGQGAGIRVGVTDQQATPAAVHGQGLAGFGVVIFGEACLQALVGGRLAAQKTLIEGSGSHGKRFLCSPGSAPGLIWITWLVGAASAAKAAGFAVEAAPTEPMTYYRPCSLSHRLSAARRRVDVAFYIHHGGGKRCAVFHPTAL
ncbi:hypothetical protein D9M68_547590 [compost metagenome]